MKEKIVSKQKLIRLLRSKIINPVVIVLFIIQFSASYAEDGSDSNNEKLAASVNGVSIDMADLSPHVEDHLSKYKKYGIQQNNEVLRSLRMQALERLIDAELLFQEAKKIDVKNLNQRIDDKLSELKKNEEFNEADFDEQKARKLLSKQILIDDYLRKMKLKNAQLPENDIKSYYDNNKDSFKRKEIARTRHILIALEEKASVEQITEALKKISNARKLILDGTPFEEVAREQSDCNSASSGGELGYQERGYMPQAYDEVAFTLKIGQLSDVIETEFGYHIIEVLDHKSAGIVPYEDIKDFISRYLNNKHQQKVMANHLSSLRQKAKIDIYL